MGLLLGLLGLADLITGWVIIPGILWLLLETIFDNISEKKYKKNRYD